MCRNQIRVQLWCIQQTQLRVSLTKKQRNLDGNHNCYPKIKFMKQTQLKWIKFHNNKDVTHFNAAMSLHVSISFTKSDLKECPLDSFSETAVLTEKGSRPSSERSKQRYQNKSQSKKIEQWAPGVIQPPCEVIAEKYHVARNYLHAAQTQWPMRESISRRLSRYVTEKASGGSRRLSPSAKYSLCPC